MARSEFSISLSFAFRFFGGDMMTGTSSSIVRRALDRVCLDGESGVEALPD
jgi:hypothetical protein